MTLRRFLDASYTLLVEGYTSVAPHRFDLWSAVEKVEESWKRDPDVPERADVAAKNDQALAQLQAMMSGVSK